MAAWQGALGAVLAAAMLAAPGTAQEAAAVAPEATPAESAPPAALVSMGTGSVTAAYFPVGVAICRLANQHRAETGLRCAARESEGSGANLAGLRDGSLGLAIVQSDALAGAAAGTGAFAAAGADTGLRSVMRLYPEALTLVVRADAGVAGIEDLAGKRVVLGQAGSGTRTLADALVAALGWTPASFGATPDLAPERLAQALCDGAIDGFLYAVGHPARVIQEATTSCDARLVPIAGGAVDELVASEPWYVAATIPGGLYRGNPGAVETFGVSAILATEAAVPDATVRLVVQSVVDDLEMLRGLDPVLSGLEPEAMTDVGPVPLHPAAEAVYRDAGWLR